MHAQVMATELERDALLASAGAPHTGLSLLS